MVTPAARILVEERAGARCEYCRAPQIITGTTFHIEHITPLARGGSDDLTNLALCCVTCNGHKSDHTTGSDSDTGREFPLFDPRRDRWGRHFRFSPRTLELRGLTPMGKATVARLQMNERKQIEARVLWVELALYP
ncbi:MAG: hypothetical protein QOE70_6454 [Chthoniobacter sp.]|jgi:hypothetical protein|nr:hypothetical protein [Chthoniobacter sp.]